MAAAGSVATAAPGSEGRSGPTIPLTSGGLIVAVEGAAISFSLAVFLTRAYINGPPRGITLLSAYVSDVTGGDES